MTGSRGGAIAAAIDVGSNSVLLLTVTVGDGVAHALDEAVATTRLGEGLRSGGGLDPAAAARTTACVVAFAARARARGATDVRAFATGAARRAGDGPAFAAAVARAADVTVEILSGEREAALAYDAVVHGLDLAERSVVAIDVGGATTELTLGRGGAIETSVSLGMGALALTESARGGVAAMRTQVAHALATTDVAARARAAGALAVASGGTATSLVALKLGLSTYDPRRVHGARIGVADLGALAGLAERGDAPIDPGRAAILPAGTCILEGVARALDVDELLVSDHGVRHAYLRAAFTARGVEASMRTLWG
jgi:exopolyphosphatase/guanosine-5'-triphosphate,3'-diphosphate pyrophosphatase